MEGDSCLLLTGQSKTYLKDLLFESLMSAQLLSVIESPRDFITSTQKVLRKELNFLGFKSFKD